jgi:hypothetical protein
MLSFHLTWGFPLMRAYRTAIELLKQDRAARKVLLIIDAYKGVSLPLYRLITVGSV